MRTAKPVSIESLLAHEPFVRAVVRGLLHDEQRVHDVVQETWLRALRRAPTKAAELKPWLAKVARNLVRDSMRSSTSRAARERSVAKGECVESVADSFDRLQRQREVIERVLDLKEPYKSVVLLRYYQDLSPAQIGQRLGASASTVRSQLSRAHGLLRRELDERADGGRMGWAALAGPGLIGASKPVPSSVFMLSDRLAMAKVAGMGALVVAAATIAFVFDGQDDAGDDVPALAALGRVEARAVGDLRLIELPPSSGARVERQALDFGSAKVMTGDLARHRTLTGFWHLGARG